MSSNANLSTFELLTLPIAPGNVSIGRKVTQGYFLTFSNITKATSVIRFLATIPSWTPANQCDGFQDRELTTSVSSGFSPQNDPSGIGNHQSILDITGGPFSQACQTDFGEMQFLGITPNNCTKLFLSRPYKICGGWSGSWALLPNLGPGPNLIANGRFEVRGWINVGILDSEAKVNRYLFNPEHRNTFYPASLQSATDPVNLSDLSQTATILETAAGRAETTLSLPGVTPSPGLSSSVQNWATANGINPSILVPFASTLNDLI